MRDETGATDTSPRILVVDDEESLTDILADLLQAEGYQVECARDGVEALRLLQGREPPALVMSDVMMPRMNGTDLVEAARRAADLERVPFLLLSAGPQPRLRWDNVQFMPKPLELDDLLDTVESLLVQDGRSGPYGPGPSRAA